jgi:hypothetical protein
MTKSTRAPQQGRQRCSTSDRRFVIVSGLKTVTSVSIEEIHALEAHYLSEMRYFFGQQPERATGVATSAVEMRRSTIETQNGGKK